jgi:hypothetical protein
MMRFLAHVVTTEGPLSSDHRLVVRLQPGSVYWLGYSLQFRYDGTTNTSAVWNSSAQSGIPLTVLPPFDASHVTLDLNGSTIDQCYSAKRNAARYDGCVANWHTARTGAGDPVLNIAGATDIRIDGNQRITDPADTTQYGVVTNSAFRNACSGGGTACRSSDPANPYRDPGSLWQRDVENLAYFNWPGLSIAPKHDSVVVGSTMQHVDVSFVGGDFVYQRAQTLMHITDPSSTGDVQDTSIDHNTFEHSGRQGVSIMGGSGVDIVANQIVDAGRHTFDSEPSPREGWQDVTIAGNRLTAGSLGLVSFSMRRALAKNLTFQDNTLIRPSMQAPGPNLQLSVGHSLLPDGTLDPNATGVTITGNTQDWTGQFGKPVQACYSSVDSPMISVSNYDAVVVQGNANNVMQPDNAVGVSGPGAATAVTTPNNFVDNPAVC